MNKIRILKKSKERQLKISLMFWILFVVVSGFAIVFENYILILLLLLGGLIIGGIYSVIETKRIQKKTGMDINEQKRNWDSWKEVNTGTEVSENNSRNKKETNKTVPKEYKKAEKRFKDKIVLFSLVLSIFFGVLVSLGQGWLVYVYKIPVLIFIVMFIAPFPRKDPITKKPIYPRFSFIVGAVAPLLIFWDQWFLFILFLFTILLLRLHIKKIIEFYVMNKNLKLGNKD